MIGKKKAKLTKVKVGLPFDMGSAEWEADETEVRAAWSLYVELTTRIAVQPLSEGEGTLREALSSLHALFAVTRSILREAGPSVGARKHSTGGIAITVLNDGIRPFLSKWHPALQEWEARKPPETSLGAHGREWPQESAFRKELEILRTELEDYAKVLAEVSGVRTS